MSGTNQFFEWFFVGLNGLGGWFVFFILGLAAIIALLYDSQRRRIPAIGWKLAVLLTAALIVPAIVFRFSSSDTRISLEQFMEVIFYFGVLGGVLPPVLAVGYFVTFQGLAGCSEGHIYEMQLGQCPECARLRMSMETPVMAAPSAVSAPTPAPTAVGPRIASAARSKSKAAAWLVMSSGRSYQLFEGETTIGRASRNDIVLQDSTVSKQHAKIVERNNHFWLYDLGSTNGVRVNGQLVREPLLLEHDDEIQFGDKIVVRFVTSRS